jgi:hypothetical protein
MLTPPKFARIAPAAASVVRRANSMAADRASFRWRRLTRHSAVSTAPDRATPTPASFRSSLHHRLYLPVRQTAIRCGASPLFQHGPRVGEATSDGYPASTPRALFSPPLRRRTAASGGGEGFFTGAGCSHQALLPPTQGRR